MLLIYFHVNSDIITFFKSTIIDSSFALHPFEAKPFVILVIGALPTKIEQRGLDSERKVFCIIFTILLIVENRAEYDQSNLWKRKRKSVFWGLLVTDN